MSPLTLMLIGAVFLTGAAWGDSAVDVPYGKPRDGYHVMVVCIFIAGMVMGVALTQK